MALTRISKGSVFRTYPAAESQRRVDELRVVECGQDDDRRPVGPAHYLVDVEFFPSNMPSVSGQFDVTP